MRIPITKEAFAVLSQSKLSPLTDWSQDEALGSIELNEDVLDRLKTLAHPGESTSDTIIRLMNFMLHGMN